MRQVVLFCLCLWAGEAWAQSTKTALFQSLTFYTGATDYTFTDARTQEVITVRVPNSPEEGALMPQIPQYLRVMGKGEVRFPEANPRWVGKPFLLHYNQEGEVIKVEKMPKRKK